jgi:hypothetical protein
VIIKLRIGGLVVMPLWFFFIGDLAVSFVAEEVVEFEPTVDQICSKLD